MRRVPWLVAGTVVPAVAAAVVLVASLPPGRGPVGLKASPGAAAPTTLPATTAPTSAPAPAQPASMAQAPPGLPARAASPLPVSSTDVSFDTRADLAASQRTVQATVWYPTTTRPGGYPLVVFAHGSGSHPSAYADLLAAVAASGFVVVAPQSGPTRATVTVQEVDADGVVTGEHEEAITSFDAQRIDVLSAIDASMAMSAEDGPLHGMVAATKVGVIGHSDGGIVAAESAFDDAVSDGRIGAAVILSGAREGAGTWFPPGSPALLAIHGDADEVNPFSSSRELYDSDAASAKYLVTILGGGHFQPLVDDATRPAIATLIGDFLRASLRSDRRALTRIPQDANAGGVLALTDSAVPSQP